MGRFVVSSVAVVALVSVLAGADRAQSGPAPPRPPVPSVAYRPPVVGQVVDPFRRPSHPYGPGNRGLSYRTAPGDPVRAIGGGVVVFTGRIGGSLYVSVAHPHGLRSTYSYLTTIAVEVGDRVGPDAGIGTAGDGFHLGVLRGTQYLDPALLFGRRHAVLVAAG